MINVKVSLDQQSDEWNLFFSLHSRPQFRMGIKRLHPKLFDKLTAAQKWRDNDLMNEVSYSLYGLSKKNINNVMSKLLSEFKLKKRLIHNYCNGFYRKHKPGMLAFIEKFNDEWAAKEELILNEFEQLMQTKLPDLTVSITLTIASCCHFFPEENSFMITYPNNVKNAFRTAIHEITHLIYFNHFKVNKPVTGSDWWRLQEVIPDIILKELIKKPKFKHLEKFTRLPGYPENKKLLKIVYTYFKKNGFKKLISQIKKDPNYFLRLEHKL